jgi:hypothetical protein
MEESMREETTKASESKAKQSAHVEPDDKRTPERQEELDQEQLKGVSGGLSMEITGDTSEKPR